MVQKMKVKALRELLFTMPDEADVEVNDNRGGQMYFIDQVDYFGPGEIMLGETETVVIQVNCE